MLPSQHLSRCSRQLVAAKERLWWDVIERDHDGVSYMHASYILGLWNYSGHPQVYYIRRLARLQVGTTSIERSAI